MSKPHLSPRQALNKSFLKLKPNRNEIENFKQEFINLLVGNNEKESEEFQKNRNFLIIPKITHHECSMLELCWFKK